MKSTPEIFFSYAWDNKTENGESREKLVNQLYDSLLQDGFNVIKDKNNLEYNGSINDFIGRLSKSDCIVVAISDKYLRSPYCMYELCEIARYSHFDKTEFRQKVLPVKIESIRFNDPDVIEKYVTHWKNEQDKWAAIVQNNTGGISVEYAQRFEKIKTINIYFSKLAEWLGDSNTLNIEALSANGFAEIKKAILKKNKLNAVPRWGRTLKKPLVLLSISAVILYSVLAVIWFQRQHAPLHAASTEDSLVAGKIIMNGYVNDSISGQGIEEAKIVVYDDQHRVQRKILTNNKGYFEIFADSIRSNWIEVQVQKKNFITSVKFIELAGETTSVSDNIQLFDTSVSAVAVLKQENSRIIIPGPVLHTPATTHKTTEIIPTVSPKTDMCQVICDTKGYAGIEVSIEDPARNKTYTQTSKSSSLVFTVPCDLLKGTYTVNFKNSRYNDRGHHYYKAKEFEIPELFIQ